MSKDVETRWLTGVSQDLFQEKIKDPIESYIRGPDVNQQVLDNESQLRVDREQSINRPLPADFDMTKDRVADVTPIGDPEGTGAYTPFYEQLNIF